MKYLLFCLCLIFFSIMIKAQGKGGHEKRDTIEKESKRKKPIILFGTASYYADKFNGRATANGEIYNGKKMTAACNVLPLGTWVRVTNLNNNRSVIVKTNDRLH